MTAAPGVIAVLTADSVGPARAESYTSTTTGSTIGRRLILS